MGFTFADEVSKAKCVDDCALTIADPESLAAFLLNLDPAQVEGRCPEDVDLRGRVIDRRAVGALWDSKVDLRRDVVGEVPVRQRRVECNHPVWGSRRDGDEVDAPNASRICKLEQATRQLEDLTLIT
ncbi:MAG: hypothetical protein ACR2ME_02805 [Acidimicrobiia bacterium]